MITVEQLHLTLGQQPVLYNLNLTLAQEGLTAIIGPNGAGKSTLLDIISGQRAPDQGRISINNRPLADYRPNELAKTLATLRQDNALNARLTVHELVCFGRFPYSQGHLSDDDREMVDQALRFLGLETLAERYLDQLSGGQRQRAFIAMVLAQDTPYLLLDEPLNNLDMRHSVDIMKRLREAADSLGKKVVIVLHDINFAACYADQIVALKEGELYRQLPPEELITREHMRHLYELDMSVHRIRDKPFGFYYL